MYQTLLTTIKQFLNKNDVPQRDELQAQLEEIVYSQSEVSSEYISINEMYYHNSPRQSQSLFKDITNTPSSKEQQYFNSYGKALIKYLQTHQKDNIVNQLDLQDFHITMDKQSLEIYDLISKYL